jgi:putative ABC transport system permease protein
MRTVIWRNLVARKLRLFFSAFAIVLGVSFVSGALVFTNAIGGVFDSIIDGGTADVEVGFEGASSWESQADNRTFGQDVVDRVEELPEVAAAYPQVSSTSVFVIGDDGKVVGGNGPPGLAFNHTEVESMGDDLVFQLDEGRFPEAPGEVTIDSNTMESGGLEVGDEVDLVTPGRDPRVSATVVGRFTFNGGSAAGATITLFELSQAQQLLLDGRDAYNYLQLTAQEGVSQRELADAVQAVLPDNGLAARTGDVVAADAKKTIDEVLGFITTFLLVFAAVALVVGVFLIINTFSILVAQRSRELALLRAMGASRPQVNRSVIAEAVGIGLIGATIGLGGGWLLARGLALLFAQFGAELGGAEFVLTWPAVVASYAVGVVVTAVAAFLPARRASRIPPVAALRDDVAMPESAIHRRVVVGSVLIAGGAAAMAAGLLDLGGDALWEIGLGIFAVVIGTALVSPVLATPVIAVFSRLYRPFGTVGVLATENSRRNPRRTAATASALMIGLALMTMMAIFGASASASTDAAIKESYRSELIISNAIGQPFSTSIAQQVREVDGVAAVASLRYANPKVDGRTAWMGAVQPRQFDQVVDATFRAGDMLDLGPGKVLLGESAAKSFGLQVGDTVTAEFQGGPVELEVAGVYFFSAAMPTEWLVTHETLVEGGLTPLDNMVFIAKEDGAATAEISAAVDEITKDLPTVKLQTMQGFADQQRQQTDQFLSLINILLALSVLIAVLGVVNTLALSVIERTHEVGLLRAVGMSRRQLRTMIRLESVLITVFGAVLGMLLGAAFGAGLVTALKSQGLTELAFPYGSMLGFTVAAVVVGVLAAVLPARRAARLDVLAAVATE